MEGTNAVEGTLVRNHGRLVVVLALTLALGLTIAPVAAQPGEAAGLPGDVADGGPDRPTAAEPYACRSDVYPFVEEATPAGPHVAGLVEAGNGDLLYTFNAHWMEGPTAVTKWGEAPVTRVYLSRLRPGSSTWTEPERVDYPRPLQIHNAVLWYDGAGTLFQFFTVIEGLDHTESTLEVMTSTDHGHTWSEPRTMRAEHGWMFGNRPFRMSNGEVILPVYRETAPTAVGFLISSDDFDTWEVHPEQELTWPGLGVALMAATVELDTPGHLLAYLRANGGRILQTRSFDYGRTWTPAVQTQHQSPWARVDLLKLDNGHLVLAHNDSRSTRSPLRLALSEDGGLTWPHAVLVETDVENRFDYPSLKTTSDGFIHIGYTHNNKRNMRHVVFTEEFVRSGDDIPSDTSYGRTQYAAGALEQVDVCAYVLAGAVDEQAYACRQDTHPWDPDNHPGSTHVAALEEAANGDLLFSMGGDQEPGITRTYLTRLATGERTWGPVTEVPYEPPYQVHNAVLWRGRDGTVHNFFTTQYGSNHSASTLDHRTSDDHGRTWSEAQVMREEHGWMFGTRPLRMSNGETLLPVYRESFPGGVGFFVSDDDFQTWQAYPQDELLFPRSLAGSLQAAVVELGTPGHLLAYMRTPGLWVHESRSFDYGRTWTPATPTEHMHPGARVDLIRLDNGNLLFASNPTPTGSRSPLRLALSSDGGRTWPHTVLVETEEGARFDYPYLVQTSDGMVHLGYTHRRLTMRHLVFNEEFVRSGRDLPSDPDYGKLELRDRQLSEVDACAYSPNAEVLQAPFACRQEIYAYDERFPGVHASSVAQLPSGDLYYTFFGGSGEGSNDVAIWGSRLAVGSTDWTHPEVVFDDPGKPEGNSVVWQNGDGRTFVFFVTQQGGSWSTANMRFIHSDDDGRTWSEPRWLREEVEWMLGNRAERLSNGDVILPIYSEPPTSSQRRVGFAITSDDWETWAFYPEDLQDWPKSPNGAIQAEAVELSPGHLLAYMRTNDGFVYQTESFDYGRTWTSATATELPNSGSRVALLKLDTGNLLIAYNPDSSQLNGRATLRLALSSDGGRTWSDGVDVENVTGSEFSYPWLFQSDDGYVHLAYTHKRLSMRHLVFNEAFVRAGRHLTSDPIVDTPFYSLTSRALFRAGATPINTCSYSPRQNR